MEQMLQDVDENISQVKTNLKNMKSKIEGLSLDTEEKGTDRQSAVGTGTDSGSN